MRTLTIIALLFLCACEESSPRTLTPLSLTVRSQGCVTVEQAAPMAVKVYAVGLPHVVCEVHYATGAGEVWVAPQGGVIVLTKAPQWAEVYPAWVQGFGGYPVRIKENGDGSLQTTTGAAIHPGKVRLWHGGANGSWVIE